MSVSECCSSETSITDETGRGLVGEGQCLGDAAESTLRQRRSAEIRDDYVTTSEGVNTVMAVMQQEEARKSGMEKMIKSESSWGKRRRT